MRAARGTAPWRHWSIPEASSTRRLLDRPATGAIQKPAFITGLTAEARLLRRLGYPVLAGGGTPQGAASCAEAAIAGGATMLVSFGLAGGLDPGLARGDVLRPAGVLWHGRVFTTDAAFLAGFGGANCTVMLAHDAILASVTEKHVFWRQTGASAVDMESGAVAEAAAAHGIGFAVLRAVCDPADRILPPAALAALDNAGRISLLNVALSLLRHPEQIPALLALAADAARARKTLIGQVACLAPPLPPNHAFAP